MCAINVHDRIYGAATFPFGPYAGSEVCLHWNCAKGMSLVAISKLGLYEILALIGAGRLSGRARHGLPATSFLQFRVPVRH
jgi:hypothetical protein